MIYKESVTTVSDGAAQGLPIFSAGTDQQVARI
jgi:hypothetical protein